MGFFKEFIDFMAEQKIIAVALAFIVGTATAALVQALVNDLISPMYQPYLFAEEGAKITIRKSEFLIGDFINNIINWIVILLVVFIIGNKMMPKASKKVKK